MQRLSRCRLLSVPAVLVACALARGLAQEEVSLRISARDDDGAPLPCRVHLRDERGEPQKAAGLPAWNDHFVCDGRAGVAVLPGRYAFEIERGPEYERRAGTVDVTSDGEARIDVALQRIARLRAEGWYSGDLHVHRPPEDVELLMRAEDLDLAPVITWWNTRNPWKDAAVPAETARRFAGHRLYDIMAGEDEREGGALLYFGLDAPLDLAASTREFPSPMHFVEEARQRNADVWIDIEKPFWWDVPTWLASGRMNSIGLANNHMCRSRMLENEAWGRPRDAERLPPPRGNGFWTQEIYYALLDAGLRLPPSAGSASGVLPNPVGYNRVYVHAGDAFSRDDWFAGLAAGRCFVTNGPLLRVRANGELPGATLEVAGGAPLVVEIVVELTSNDHVPALELVHNGRVAASIPCAREIQQKKTFELAVEEAGWFLVRAIADIDETFRFASTAPWYVETDTVKHRISRRAARRFADWVAERIERVRRNLSDPEHLRAVLEPHEKAGEFWRERVEAANAD